MKRWFKYVKPYLPYFIIGPLCMIIEVIGEVLMPKLLSNIINNANAGALTVGSSIGTMFLMILIAVIMMAGGVGGAYFGAKASVNFATDLRADAYAKIQKFSFSSIDKFSTGSLVTRLTNDIAQLQNFINMLLRMALRAPGMLIAALIMAILLQPSLSVVLAVTIPLMLIVIGFIIKNGFSRFGAMQEKIDRLNTNVQENLTNVRVVKSFVREDHEIDKFAKTNRTLKEASMDAFKVMIFMQPAITVFINITTLAVVWFGGKTVLRNGMEVGDLSAYLTYVTQILSSLMMITMMLMFSSRALASARRIREILEEKIDMDDTNAAHPDKEVTEGAIEFRNVTFRYYKTSEKPVLDRINLTIKPGSTVGIIGSTGCGKTTLVSMIPRLYDTDKGEVLVDGVNVKDYSLKRLRDGIGMVLQQNTLFSGTIAENLRWGNPNATEEDIEKAAIQSQADKFIGLMKEKYDTVVEHGGTNLSGGQKQRLCIARALIKKPKIIILDDSTSAVDTATEALIRRSFKNELKGSTKIIIAQRISSVIDADEIIVMDDGKVTGIGTHEELLASNKEYQEIVYSQNGQKGA
ncbi:MAG: ABC transporter ATP-binding protein [Clostridiaceae bacterium]|nr:ABC transporter ATP-binding protein [Clostridiaceae bacterium]